MRKIFVPSDNDDADDYILVKNSIMAAYVSNVTPPFLFVFFFIFVEYNAF